MNHPWKSILAILAALMLSAAPAASGNRVLGIHVESGASGTTLTSNTAKANNGYDLCDQGTGTILGAGNTIGTTGCP